MTTNRHPGSGTRRLHVAAAQIHSGGAMEETLQRVERQVTAASAMGANVILFSECALHGYDYDMTPESVRAVAEPVDGPHCRRILDMAQRRRIAILIGFLERNGDAIHNSVLIARPEGTLETARKHMLTEGEVAARLTPAPRERTVVELNGVRCAIIICADGGIEGLHEELSAKGVDYRFCPTGGGGKIGDMLHELDLQTPEGRARYIANRPRVFKTEAMLDEKECPATGFASANALGPAGRQTCHQGHCMIVDNQRVMRGQIPGTIVLDHMEDQMIHARLQF